MGDRQTGQISENSKRIAKNTLALYFRMFLLMAIMVFAFGNDIMRLFR